MMLIDMYDQHQNPVPIMLGSRMLIEIDIEIKYQETDGEKH